MVAGCGDDQPTAAGDGTGTGASTSEGEDAGTTVAADETGPVATTTGVGQEGSDDAPADDPPVFAHGMRLTRMTANQATQVELVNDGVEVDVADYNTRLISGRRTLLRAFWTLHADFTPREIIGRLVIDYPDGNQLVQDFPLMVNGDSNDGGASFQWLLEPEDVVDGALYRVRLLESDPTLATGEVSDPPPILPLAGRGTLGVYDVPLEIEVVLIPVLHEFEGEECMPDITDEDALAMGQDLEQNNPIQRAVMSVGEPMPYTDPIGTSGTSFSPVLSALAQRRAMDNPPPHVYYYGLVDPCDGYPPGLLGQAIGIPPIPPTPEMAQQRISTGRWNGSGAAAAETFTHEVGHTQGRYHVLCSGGEGGPDLAYPHPNGRIGVWGFGIHDFGLRSPTGGRDYMTYCSNEWVSDYAWELTMGVIEILTSWSRADMTETPGNGLLMGALYSDGTEEWWTAPGGLPEAMHTPGASVLVTREGGETTLPAFVQTRPDSDTVQVMAPRPAEFADVLTLDIALPDRAAPTELRPSDIADLYSVSH